MTNLIIPVVVLAITAIVLKIALYFQQKENETISDEIDRLKQSVDIKIFEDPVEPNLTDQRLKFAFDRFTCVFLEVKSLKSELKRKDGAIEILKEELKTISDNDNFSGE